MGRALLWSLPLIAAFTLAIALLGLAYGWAQTAAIERESYAGWFIPHNVENLRRFPVRGLYAQFRLSRRGAVHSRRLAISTSFFAHKAR